MNYKEVFQNRKLRKSSQLQTAFFLTFLCLWWERNIENGTFLPTPAPGLPRQHSWEFSGRRDASQLRQEPWKETLIFQGMHWTPAVASSNSSFECKEAACRNRDLSERSPWQNPPKVRGFLSLHIHKPEVWNRCGYLQGLLRLVVQKPNEYALVLVKIPCCTFTIIVEMPLFKCALWAILIFFSLKDSISLCSADWTGSCYVSKPCGLASSSESHLFLSPQCWD